MRRFAKENGLSLLFAVLFVAALVGQSFAGLHNYNAELAEHGDPALSWLHYLVSPDFGGAVMENWQSEFLQFSLFIAATIWLLQKGSNESKRLDRAGRETDEQQLLGEHAKRNSPPWARAGGLRTGIYSNSLVLVMGSIWLASWLAQSIAGRVSYNADQVDHHAATVSWPTYITTSDFWNRTLQNWQSEFLAVGSMVALSIYLRQRGSPESKPVGAAHSATGVEG